VNTLKSIAPTLPKENIWLTSFDPEKSHGSQLEDFGIKTVEHVRLWIMTQLILLNTEQKLWQSFLRWELRHFC
jgi:hypothetical protein